MKKIIFFVLFFFINSVQSQAISFVPFVYSDPGDFSGSLVSTILYSVLDGTEKDNAKFVDELVSRRRKSLRYLTGGVIFATTSNKLKEIENRLLSLQRRNDRLLAIHYSRKKKNKVMIGVISKMIENMRSAVENPSAVIKYGDAMLYHENLTSNMEKINEILNNLEEDIEDSEFILNRIKELKN